ncbi:hypothetical protein F3Y22_tig00111191pilonHSYRG00175 [Hibiscus syriacus]|uniref:Uncharacterized protein n=1 Tax=Hibiscus syriacus TaxID=106335 RepID=A0A6A2YWD2_HIBSY|nr:hypothetical protein F3Y22_tig00111191pilonHSYRG00175 [Hibiscus syriacus]
MADPKEARTVPETTGSQRQNMLPAFYQSCSGMKNKWEKIMSTEGCSEIDAWPYLVNMTRDVISRAAFGSSFEEGSRILNYWTTKSISAIKVLQSAYIPGWRKNAIRAGEECNEDLLDILVEANIIEIEAHADRKNMGMSIDDVVEECKLFYSAGQETTSTLLIWTMILLARYPDWQSKAGGRFCKFLVTINQMLTALIVSKFLNILVGNNDIVRGSKAIPTKSRTVPKELKLGNPLLPDGTEVLVPILQIHRDGELCRETTDMNCYASLGLVKLLCEQILVV